MTKKRMRDVSIESVAISLVGYSNFYNLTDNDIMKILLSVLEVDFKTGKQLESEEVPSVRKRKRSWFHKVARDVLGEAIEYWENQDLDY